MGPAIALILSLAASTAAPRVLVFSKTAGYRHASIPHGISAVKAVGTTAGFATEATEDAAAFRDDNLKRFAAVVFLSTTGDVLDEEQQQSFERYVRTGGGFVGIHAASDTEYDWPWYGRLVGAWFANHPEGTAPATVRVVDRSHPSTWGLPAVWVRTDEWYNFKARPQPSVRVLLTVDEKSYAGGTMGDGHPLAWCHELEKGRAWYTAMGHTEGSYSEPLFLQHVRGGIRYAARAED